MAGCGSSSSDSQESVLQQPSVSTPVVTPTDTNVTDSDVTQTDQNETAYSSLGVLKFSVANQSTKVLKYTYEASGELVATTDKLANAISEAERVNEEYIESINNVFEIKMPQTSNAAVAIFSYDKTYGLVLSEKQVKSGQTTDLGEIELLPTRTLVVKINSFNNENVGLAMNLIGLNQSVPTNQDITINHVPQGKHLITVSRDGKVVVSKYVDVQNDMSIEINLDNYQNMKMTGVLKDENGNPVDKAVVFLKPTNDNYLISLSDVNGNFEFDNLMDGNFTLIVQKSGFKAIKKENILVQGGNIDLGTLTMPHDVTTGSIAGYAYFSDSTEHAGIDITIEKIGGGYETNQYGTLQDGAFLITDLPEGNYTLHFGKSSDSSYSQEDVTNIEVLAGTTRVLEDPVILEKLTAVIEGVVELPVNFSNEDVKNVKLEVLDLNGTVLASQTFTSLDANNTVSFSIVVPSGKSGYVLRISGYDAQGNMLNTYTTEIPSLTTGYVYTVKDPIQITYVDPNPPVINSVTVSKVLGVMEDLGNDTYLINPDNKIQIDVSAQDKDGDEITYYFSANAGTLSGVDQQTGKATYTAPSTGGDYTVTITAKSASRSTSKTIFVKVNHYPIINLNSPTDILNPNEPKEYESAEEVVINTDISDAEDSNLSIEWYSSIQGLIDTNTTVLQKRLIAGNHIIKVFAKDSLGLVSSKTFYIKVLPQDTVWLRTPNSSIKRYITTDGITLNDTYQISIASDYQLQYSSNDENVVTVDQDGLIKAVNAGSAIVHVTSNETDNDGNPLYSFNIYVRVVDDIKNVTPDENGYYHIKPGQIYQVRVNSDNKPTIILDVPASGNYEFLTFDNHDIVQGSYSCATYYVNGSQSGSRQCGVGNSIFNVDVFDPDDEFKIELKPYSTDYDEVIKVALVPSGNVLLNDNLLPSYFFDAKYEFNDITQLSKDIGLYNAYISDINVFDYDRVDYYSLNISKKGTYSLLFQTLQGTDGGTKYIEIYSPNDVRVATANIYSDIGFQWISFDANEIGKYRVKVYNSSNYITYYQFNLYPSATNGLIQDTEGEVNDMPSMATPITLAQVEEGIKGSINVRKTDIADWYEIEFDKTGTYGVLMQSLTGSSTSGNKYIEVYNPSGDRIFAKYVYSYNSAETSGWFSLDITEVGKYKIKIYNANNEITYYKFNIFPSVENGLVQDSGGEYNDLPSMATPVTLDEAQNGIKGDVALTDIDKADWYEIELNKTGTYGLLYQTLAGTSTDGNKYIQVYNPNGDSVLSGYLYSGAVEKYGWFSFTASMPGKYKIKIYNSENERTYYQFNLYPSTENGLVHDSEGEVNDLSFMADPVTLEDVENGIYGKVKVLNTDIADWYELNITQAGTYSVTIQTTAGSNTSHRRYIEIYDSEGGEIFSDYLDSFKNGEGASRTTDLNILEPGLYRVKIYDSYGDPWYYWYSIKPKN